ncbi:MAG: hypothetical protein ACYTFG_02565 [Planctomycetota bacterium]|jgi:hypothetical protein
MAAKKAAKKVVKKAGAKKTGSAKPKARTGGDARSRSLYFDSMTRLRNHGVNSVLMSNLVFVAFQVVFLAVFSALLTTAVPVVLAVFAVFVSYVWHLYYASALEDLGAAQREFERLHAEVAAGLDVETKLVGEEAVAPEMEVTFGPAGEKMEKPSAPKGPLAALRILPAAFCGFWVVVLPFAIYYAS